MDGYQNTFLGLALKLIAYTIFEFLVDNKGKRKKIRVNEGQIF